jgi:predicted AAA+ superfamily ATPase
MLPLTLAEAGGGAPVDDWLRFGGLPLVRGERGVAARVDLLEAYVDTYLTQEIRAEALVRSLDGFVRFLEVAALANAQVTNVASLARDAAVARPTVQGYFEVLTDTLIGAWLPAWRPRAKVKETSHPKFYLFDCGVARALAGRAQVGYAGLGGSLAYYRTPSGTEVDFVWSRGQRAVGIEVKASPRWRPEFGSALAELHGLGVLSDCVAVYLGDRPLQAGPVRVLPLQAFANELAAGRVLRAR